MSLGLKSSVKKYELPLNRFSKEAVPQFVGQLQKHKENIERHKFHHDWEKARKEALNGQHVTSQLKSAIREVEEVGQHLSQQDEPEFLKLIEPHIKRALDAIKSFNTASQVLISTQESSSHSNFDVDEENTPQLKQIALQYDEKLLEEEIEVESKKAQLETVENLQHDIEELHDLFNQFAQNVQAQAEPVNQIENNVEAALENVQEGERSLAKAARLKATLYPLTGALLGTCIGGPVGLLAGLKIGAVAALGGTVLGFTSGRVVKQWQQKQTENSENPSDDSSIIRSQSHSNEMNCNAESPVSLPKSSTLSCLSTKDGGSSSQPN